MQVWPFLFLRRGAREFLEYRNSAQELSGGRRVAQKLHAAGELVVRGSLLFPNPGGTWAAFVAFWNARFGSFEAFLYKPQDLGAAEAADAFVAAAGETDWTATRRYVDTATLVVKKAGVVQTLGVHYTVENEAGGAYVLGTSTALVVAFAAAPGAGVAIALEYEFYVPVRFESDDQPDEQDIITGGRGAAAAADRTVMVQLREAGPGWSYAAAPNAL